jgi:hypothetical protein
MARLRFWPKTGWARLRVVLVGILLVLLYANEFAIFTTGRRFEKLLDEARAAGMPVALAELAGPPVPANEDAAPPLVRAASAAALMRANLQSNFAASAFEDPFDEKMLAAVAAAVSADPQYEVDLNAADLAAAYRSPAQVDAPIFNISLIHLQNYTRLAQIEAMRAAKLRLDHKPGDAFRLILRQLRLTRKWAEKEPFAMSFYAWYSARCLATQELNRLLRTNDVPPSGTYEMVEALLTDEQWMREAFRKCLATERIMAREMHNHPSLQFMNNPLLEAWKNHEKIRFWDSLSRQIDALDEPFVTSEEINHQIAQTIKGTALARAGAPGVDKFFPAAGFHRYELECCVALSRCARIVNAWRRTHAAKPTLDQMGLPPGATIDPYTGRPLKVVEKPNGWLIYSVGADLKDDGGAIAPGLYKDVGLGPEPMK